MINGTIHMTTCERDAVLSAQKKVELIHEHKNKARLTKAKVRLLITVCILDGWTDFHSSIGYTCPKHQPKKKIIKNEEKFDWTCATVVLLPYQ